MPSIVRKLLHKHVKTTQSHVDKNLTGPLYCYLEINECCKMGTQIHLSPFTIIF